MKKILISIHPSRVFFINSGVAPNYNDLRNLFKKVNKVTLHQRQGRKWSEKDLTSLANYQLKYRNRGR